MNRPAEPYNTFVPCFSGVTVLWHKMDTLIYAMNRLILECLCILYTADLSYALEPCVNATVMECIDWAQVPMHHTLV